MKKKLGFNNECVKNGTELGIKLFETGFFNRVRVPSICCTARRSNEAE